MLLASSLMNVRHGEIWRVLRGHICEAKINDEMIHADQFHTVNESREWYHYTFLNPVENYVSFARDILSYSPFPLYKPHHREKREGTGLSVLSLSAILLSIPPAATTIPT